MSIHVSGVVYVLLVLGAILIIASGLVEIITFLLERLFSWFARQGLSGNNLVIYLQQIICLSWHVYTEYLADLAFFGFALAFLIEKLANIPSITLAVLVQTMTDMSWLWIAVLVSAVLWFLAKRSRQKRADRERMSLEDKIDSGFKEVNQNLSILINEIRQGRDEQNKL